MRRSGFVDSAGGFECGHVGCAYEDRESWRARAAEFIVDGFAHRQLIEYVGAGSIETLEDELDQILASVGRSREDGAVRAVTAGDFYSFRAGSDILDPIASVAARLVAGAEATAAGYGGARSILDATALARTPAQRHACAQFEHLIDARMATLPAAALCGYDARQLGRGVSAELVCLHPLVTAGDAGFRLHASEDVDLVLAGEIDLANEAQFAVALERILGLNPARESVIDCRGLAYLDHRGLDLLDRMALAEDRTVRLVNAPPVVTRLVELMGPPAIALGPPAQKTGSSR